MPLSDYPPDFLALGRANWYAKLDPPYVPKLGQRLMDEAVDAGKRFVSYFAPPQDGKSYHIARSVGSYLMLPDTHLWIVGATYQDASKEYGYLYQDLAGLGLLRTARRKHFDIRGGNMHTELRNGSWVQVISAENPENLRREQLDVVILAEASKLTENLYDRYLYGRVERRRGKVFTGTTHKGYGWIWQDFAVPSFPMKPKSGIWGPWKDGRREILAGEPNPDYDPDYWSCQVSYVPEFGDVLHTGEYPPEVIEKARRRLPAPMFAEQFGGEAASYAGLVYPFDPTVHECEPFEIPRDWTHVVGYDHGAGGGSDPTVIVFGSYSPRTALFTRQDGGLAFSQGETLYWWGEIFDTEVHSIRQRAGYIKSKLNGRNAIIMRGRDQKQVAKELLDEGLFSSYSTDPEVTARIIRMTELLQTRKMKFMRGRVPNGKREILAYEWDEKNPGKPIDRNDHWLEAAGYASLAPVDIPEATVPDENLGETIEQRVERMRTKLVWGEWQKERREAEDRATGRSLESIFEPNPLEEEQLVVESYAP